MSNLLAFLEAMGQNAEMRHADSRTLYDALNETSVDAEACWAIMRGDSTSLATLLKAPHITCCVFAPKKNDEDEEAPQDDDEIRLLLIAA
jgi:hypothetical protein